MNDQTIFNNPTRVEQADRVRFDSKNGQMSIPWGVWFTLGKPLEVKVVAVKEDQDE